MARTTADQDAEGAAPPSERDSPLDGSALQRALALSALHSLQQASASSRGLVGRLVNEIGLRIVAHDLPPGTLLPNESDWCGRLGVSRTVLREATKVLVSKGLIESRPKTGTRVRQPVSWNILDPDVLTWQLAVAPRDRFVGELFELRRVVEPAVATLAAVRASAQQIALLEEAYREMEAAGDDSRRFIGPDMRFHQTILTAVENSMLRALSGAIETALTLSLHLSLETPRGQRQSLPLHKAVLDAIRARDPDAARDAMHRLIDDAEEDVCRALKMQRRAPGSAKTKSELGRRKRA